MFGLGLWLEVSYLLGRSAIPDVCRQNHVFHVQRGHERHKEQRPTSISAAGVQSVSQNSLTPNAIGVNL